MAKKLTLDEVTKKETKKLFNTKEALAEFIPKEKMKFLFHKAQNITIIGAKDTGKTFPVKLYELYTMEKDPKASTLDLRKYSTGAAKRLARSFSSVTHRVQSAGFKLPHPYEQSQSFMYRKDKKNKRNNLLNQSQEYGSFEDENGIAGIEVANGGYFSVIHVEEPALKDDIKPTERAEWDSAMKTIIDSVKRSQRSYLKTNPYFPPIPLKIFYTMNDWDEGHPKSEDAQLYSPREKFLDWVLGINYNSLLEKYKDTADGETVIPELKEFIDKNWEDIKESVQVNHTQMVYVEKNKFGKILDELFVRMQKFSNPDIQEDENEKEQIFNDMYMALVTANSFELARVFGMVYDGSSQKSMTHNFKDFKTIDTDEFIKDKDRDVLGFSLGWDIDVNRRLVATPVTISAEIHNMGNPFQPKLVYKEYKVCIHPQVEIEAYGKGAKNIKIYADQMKEVSKILYDKYVGKKILNYGSYSVFDDNQTTWAEKLESDLLRHGYRSIESAKKHGKIETGGFGILSRQDMWSTTIDDKTILVDSKNLSLIEFLTKVPKSPDTGKRIEKGRFEKLADYVNSAEYGWWTWRNELFKMDLY